MALPDAQQYELVAHDVDESIEDSSPFAGANNQLCPPSVLTRTSLVSGSFAGNVDARQSEGSPQDSELTGPIDAGPVVGRAADVHETPPSELKNTAPVGSEPPVSYPLAMQLPPATHWTLRGEKSPAISDTDQLAPPFDVTAATPAPEPMSMDPTATHDFAVVHETDLKSADGGELSGPASELQVSPPSSVVKNTEVPSLLRPSMAHVSAPTQSSAVEGTTPLGRADCWNDAPPSWVTSTCGAEGPTNGYAPEPDVRSSR
jgi:hypothetical protein